MSILEEEFGVERYSDLLSKYFKDNQGPTGPAGLSNTLIAKEVRYKAITATGHTLYTGFTHTIQPGELEAGDIIWFDFWYTVNQLTSIDYTVIWETFGGDQHKLALQMSNNSNNHYIWSIGQDAGDTSILIASTHGSFLTAGAVSALKHYITETDGSPKYDWLLDGGHLKIKVEVVIPAIAPFPGLWTRAYYYHMKSSA